MIEVDFIFSQLLFAHMANNMIRTYAFKLIGHSCYLKYILRI